jgi:hypothetical protein
VIGLRDGRLREIKTIEKSDHSLFKPGGLATFLQNKTKIKAFDLPSIEIELGFHKDGRLCTADGRLREVIRN